MDSWQLACVKLEQRNESLCEQLADQESYVEQLNGALEQKDEELKIKTKENLKPTAAVATRKSQWGDSGRDLLSGGSVSHTHSSTDAALASAGARLFDAITNSRYQSNVGLLQMSSFSHGLPADNGARPSGNDGNDGSGPSGSQPDGRKNGGTGDGTGNPGSGGDPDPLSSASSSSSTSSSSSSSESSSSSSEEWGKKKKKKKKKKDKVTRKEAEKVSVPDDYVTRDSFWGF